MSIFSFFDEDKKGGKCFGCLCDYRRAVIILNVIVVVAYIIPLLFFIVGSAAIAVVDEDDFDDDYFNDEVLDEARRYTKIRVLILATVVFFSLVAIIGAKNFNNFLVATNIIWWIFHDVAQIILSIQETKHFEEEFDVELPQPIGLYITVLIGTCLFIYPHIAFIHEVNIGIMSPDTYQREEYSCCCTTNKSSQK